MRAHTAEHILSGIFHKLYGVENTGFHLGASEVTFDTSLVITEDQLELAEKLANEAVIRNLAVTEYYPTPEELPTLTYRSKLDLTENVRIVYIEDTDACACCAPHVKTTGEIGFIKILDAVKHKGGSRIRMLAGKNAYAYVSAIARETGAVSVLLSSPATEISKDVERLLAAKCELDERLLQRERELAAFYADTVPETEGNFVLPCGTLDMEALRDIANSVGERVGGALVLLSGSDGNYRYVMRYSKPDFKTFISEANSVLIGKGGGRPPMAQGSFTASLSDIKAYFLNKTFA
jgi:alanyl-tRNA synthetase